MRREDPVRDPIYALDSNGERIKEGSGYKMTDSDYKGTGERQYFKPVTGASYTDGEENYKDGDGGHAVKDKRVDCYDEYKQIMPLRGQGEAGFEKREEWQNRGADAPTGSLSYLRKSESSLLGGDTPDVPHDVQDRNFTGNYPVSIFTRGADKAGNTFDADYGKLCMDLYGDSGNNECGVTSGGR